MGAQLCQHFSFLFRVRGEWLFWDMPSLLRERHLQYTDSAEREDAAELTLPLCGGLEFELSYFYIPSALPGLAWKGPRSMFSE